MSLQTYNTIPSIIASFRVTILTKREKHLLLISRPKTTIITLASLPFWRRSELLRERSPQSCSVSLIADPWWNLGDYGRVMPVSRHLCRRGYTRPYRRESIRTARSRGYRYTCRRKYRPVFRRSFRRLRWPLDLAVCWPASSARPPSCASSCTGIGWTGSRRRCQSRGYRWEKSNNQQLITTQSL